MKTAALMFLAAAAAAGGTATALKSPLKGPVFVRFQQKQPDGTVRELGRSGCYDFDKVKVTVEACKP